MKAKTTKEKLLHILKRNKSITIDDLMTYFTISEVAVRKHLHEMERKGLISKTAHKQQIGRPYYTYSLTKKGHGQFPNQYERLPVELLEDLEELRGRELVEELLYKRMEREEQELAEQLSGLEFEDKVRKLVEFQNEAGYMLEVEKTPEGDFRLTNFNCPIANIAYQYRQVCTNEKTMYNRVFSETEVIPEEHITTGAHVCRWVIKAPEPEKKAGS